MKFLGASLFFTICVLLCSIDLVHGKKKATVRLFMHKLENNGFITDVVGGALSITGEGGKHWALVVQFDGDDMVYLCELHRDPNIAGAKGSGGIKWICQRMTKEEVMRGKEGISTYNFGTIYTTPEELYQKCSEIPYNGQDYNLIIRNCQHWVKHLLKDLGMDTTWFHVEKFLKKTTGPGWLISKFEKHGL